MKYEYIRLNVRKGSELASRIENYAKKKGIEVRKCLEYIIIKTLEEDVKNENINS